MPNQKRNTSAKITNLSEMRRKWALEQALDSIRTTDRAGLDPITEARKFEAYVLGKDQGDQ